MNKYIKQSTLERLIYESKLFKKAIYLDDVDSTNNEAKRLLLSRNSDFQSGIIIAKNQYAGRGRLGRNWIAKPGETLCFSLVLNAEDTPKYTALSLSAAEFIHKSLNSIEKINKANTKLSIKWPNDILAEGNTYSKICGVLCENIFLGGKLKAYIIGVGINLYSSRFITDNNKLAGSIKSEFNFEIDIDNLFYNLITSANYYLKNDSFDDKYINAHSCITNKKIKFEKNNVLEEAKVIEIQKDGSVLAFNTSGNKIEILSGEIIV